MSTLQRGRILAVDDNPTNLAILEELLGDDYEVVTASSGSEALERAESLRPSLVLLDVMMPDMSGYEVCARLRATRAMRHAKIIMVSAKALVNERLEGYQAGADDYVTKPFETDELLFKVKVFLKLGAVEELDRLKTDVLSLLAHEVRTPLNCLILPAEMLRSSEPMEEAQRQRLGEIMYRNAVGLHEFFEKALSLSAMKAGRWTPTFESTAMSDIVAEAIGNVADQAVARGVTIEREGARDLVLRVDLSALVRALTALLDNAVRLSPPGSAVTVVASSDGDVAAIEVTDHGPGIAAEQLGCVFDELVDLTEGRHEKGHGLSLALAREIVLAHDGRISARGADRGGAVFRIELPLAVEGAPATASGRRESLRTSG